MTNPKSLHAKLARSLDQANKHQTRIHVKPPPPKAAAPDRRCRKISISLFATDVSKLDAIAAYMAAHGHHRISTSQAVKLALRTAPLSDALEDAMRAIQAEDGRKW